MNEVEDVQPGHIYQPGNKKVSRFLLLRRPPRLADPSKRRWGKLRRPCEFYFSAGSAPRVPHSFGALLRSPPKVLFADGEASPLLC